MQTEHCPACGGVVNMGVLVCPHCGARLRRPLQPVWVFTFFVMGILIGLLLLLLQEGRLPSLPMRASTSMPAAGEREAEGGTPRRPQLAPQAKGGTPAVSPPAPVRIEPMEVEPIVCDRKAAQAVRDKARTLALFSEQGGELHLHLSGDWAYFSAGHRRSFVNAFAEADRCLAGRIRPIRFIFRGEAVALIDASGSVQMK